LEQDIFSEVFDNDIDQFMSNQNLTEEEQEYEIDSAIEDSLRNDIENLLTNGSISKEVDVAGHTFVIRTLTIGEELAIADACKEYDGTFAHAKALATATVAASIESIDGRPLMRSLGPNQTGNIKQKFVYIKNKWYWAIINELYEEYMVLLDKQIVAFGELRKK
jgi:hypothetical protein